MNSYNPLIECMLKRVSGSAAILGFALLLSGPALGSVGRHAGGVDDRALPASSGNMDAGNVVYTVTDVGGHGWFDPIAAQNMGSGFVFGGGVNALFHGGLILATAADDVLDACYGSDDNGATTPFDFEPGIPVEIGAGGGDQYGFATFSAGGRYCVRQFSYAWAAGPDNDYVIVEFEITNIGPAGDVYAGWYADWDIGNATENEVGYDAARRLGYMSDATATDPNVYGIAGLSHPLSGFRAVFNPVWVYPDGEGAGDPGFEDADKFDFLTGFGTTASDVPDDWSVEVGMGPFALDSGETVRVAILMAAGTNLADLQANTDAAQAQWSGGIVQPIMSRQAAADLVEAAVIDLLPEKDVLIGYAPLCQIPGGVDIHDGDADDGRLVTTTADLSWLVWLDLEPFSRFGHPVRHVVVDARTGTVATNAGKRWWPAVDGVSLYDSEDDRNDSPDVVYVGPTSPAAGKSSGDRGEFDGLRGSSNRSLRETLGLSRRERADNDLARDILDRLGGDETSKWGLFVSTMDTSSEPSAKADIECAYDVLTTAGFSGRGADIPDSNVTYMNNPTKAELCAMMETLAQNCDKFYVYWTGHGLPDTLCMQGEDLTAADFADKLKDLNAKEYCVILATCHSGSILDDLADAGINGFHSAAAHPDSTGKYWDPHHGQAFTGDWYSHFLWQCIGSGLEGYEAFAWAESTLKAYSDSIFAAHPEWGMGYQGANASRVFKFTATGSEGGVSASPACSTLCFRFVDDGSGACANSTVYCEVREGSGTSWKTKKIWNWNLGMTRYLHAFGDPGATGKYKIVPHSNSYPVIVDVRWLADTATPETATSAPIFPAYSLGWTDVTPGEFNTGLGGGGSYFVTFNVGLPLDQVPAFAGTPGTKFFNQIGVQFPLAIDPDRPWLYRDKDPFLGYVEPIIVQMHLTSIFDENFQPVSAAIIRLEAWQGGVPIQQQDVQAFNTPSGVQVEPFVISAPVLPEHLEIRYAPLLSKPLEIGGAIIVLDALTLENHVMNPSSTDEPDPSTLAVRLLPNTPNPFPLATVLRFALPREETARLGVYDLGGRLVRTLVDGKINAGEHAIPWDGRDGRGLRVSSGVYFYRLEVSDGVKTRKMVMAR